MSDIIVGYDGSECARAALHTALEVAAAYGDKVVIAFGYELSPVAGELHDYAAALKDMATKRLAEGSALAAASGAQVETAVVTGGPAAGLVELADARDARVIVVGTRGESPLKGALLGSTPHKLLQLSDRPVLVVPAPQ